MQGEGAEEKQRELVYRHIAWLTALRHQLRLAKPWEHTDIRLNTLFPGTVCEDYNNRLERELEPLISKEEIKHVLSKANPATQLMKNQSLKLQNLKDEGRYDDFRHMELHQLMVSFYADQGKSERIKNFPFLRQYASTALWLTWVFAALLPLALLDIFQTKGEVFIWFTPVVAGLIIWIFFLMEKIGDYSENPFEGTYNDVPITTIARGIEIDLREMMNEKEVPSLPSTEYGFQM